MDQFWLGAGAIAGLSLVATVIWTVLRIKKLESLTWQATETIQDEKIKSSVSVLSNDELDALLSKDLSDGKPKG